MILYWDASVPVYLQIIISDIKCMLLSSTKYNIMMVRYSLRLKVNTLVLATLLFLFYCLCLPFYCFQNFGASLSYSNKMLVSSLINSYMVMTNAINPSVSSLIQELWTWMRVVHRLVWWKLWNIFSMQEVKGVLIRIFHGLFYL